MLPRKTAIDVLDCAELISMGRQALMSSVSSEFTTLETVTEFLLVRNAPRMTAAESAGKPQQLPA
ncbi:MAG: hypothetical protein O3B95_04190 [Chloroflexi bacterium]|nr:hypothetical protein [Chloroflexota bacterium]